MKQLTALIPGFLAGLFVLWIAFRNGRLVRDTLRFVVPLVIVCGGWFIKSFHFARSK